jgi:cytochrome P450
MVSFDLRDPAFLADPYPFYAQLRARAPVHHLADRDLWVLSRHADVVAALRDPQRFSSDAEAMAAGRTTNPFKPADGAPAALLTALRNLPGFRVLLTTDPPEHTRLRRMVTKPFAPRAIAAWEPRIRAICEQLVDQLLAADDDRRDLVGQLAWPLPVVVIAEMLGIPPERAGDFKRWSDDLIGALVGSLDAASVAGSALEIFGFFCEILEQRRDRPGDDLISVLVAGSDENGALTPMELVAFCILLLVAGNETTTNLIANAVLALSANPAVRDELGRRPELVSAAVEETLRYDSPAQGLMRATPTEGTVEGVTIPAGSQVLLLLGSANRDPAHWTAPDTFRLDRDPNDHLGFGTGIHVCLGAPLARLETRIALETLLSRTSGLAVSGEPDRFDSPVLRGLRSLPITVEANTVAAKGGVAAR